MKLGIIAFVLISILVGAIFFSINKSMDEREERESFCLKNNLEYRSKNIGYGNFEYQCFNETGIYEMVKRKNGEVILILK
ncbi:hypothetical protein LCGC14_0476740 [marine sediment metagenome]|uniref:Uncharacterized protein n=1 Tax=marine sediment metagenome TaxID=412755 RepID=A0A0F9UXP0_9ZZZZ